jgi:hypothetical protein
MSLFKKVNKNNTLAHTFNKGEVIQEVLDSKDECCPGWNFFRVLKAAPTIGKIIISGIDEHGHLKQIPDLPMRFTEIISDFLAIYTDVITKEIKLKGNPFSEYKRTTDCAYQIVREIYITDQDVDDEDESLYKKITAKSAKELFIKLKREQE